MKYGVLGTGDVAQTIASKLIELGHTVMLGSRESNNQKSLEWSKKNGKNAKIGTFKETAIFGERIFNCVKGIFAIDALKSAEINNLKGKILIDLTNPYIYKDGHIILDSKYSGHTSLGEEIQKLIPETKVVKTLNYLGCNLMTNPQKLNDDITGFYCGNDVKAKESVKEILNNFGWKETFDLGDITMARYTEMLGAFWVPVYGQLGNMNWGLKLVKDLKK
jgi:hypothetical protein